MQKTLYETIKIFLIVYLNKKEIYYLGRHFSVNIKFERLNNSRINIKICIMKKTAYYTIKLMSIGLKIFTS